MTTTRRRLALLAALALVATPGSARAQEEGDDPLVAATYHRVTGETLDFARAAEEAASVRSATPFDRPDALKAEGHEGVAFEIGNAEYTRGTARSFDEWEVKLALPEAEAQKVLSRIESSLDSQPIFPLSNKIGGRVASRMAADAVAAIRAHIDAARAEGRVILELPSPDPARFVAPTLIRVASIRDMGAEIFGPVVHVATFLADGLDRVIADVNATGYGLTFGLHSRIESRADRVADTVHAGNIYVNRNQIGAVVGSQPFGGEGLSGTGPKAGGPDYLRRFAVERVVTVNTAASGGNAALLAMEEAPR